MVLVEATTEVLLSPLSTNKLLLLLLLRKVELVDTAVTILRGQC